ncbi:unnamed protein product, partial [Rotaria sp. Silwood1]
MTNDPLKIHNVRRYSSVHKSTTNLLSNDPNEAQYSSPDLQSINSSSNDQENLIRFSIRSDQRNPLPNYFDKIISPPNHSQKQSQPLSNENNRVHPSVSVQRISRSSTYRKQINIPVNDQYRRSRISVPQELYRAPNKLRRRVQQAQRVQQHLQLQLHQQAQQHQQHQQLQARAHQQHTLEVQQSLILVSHLMINNYMFKMSLIILGNDLQWNQTGAVVVNQFKNAAALYIGTNDTLYVSDAGNNHVQQWSQCATSAETIAGSNTSNSGSTSTLFDSPDDITFDKYGYMYVADHNNHRVQRFPPNSNIGTTVAGTGTKSGALTDLDHLAAIDVDDNLNIYIADIHNDRIVKWASNATSGTVVVSNSLIDKSYDILLSPSSSNQVYTSNSDKDKVYIWTFGNNSPTSTLSQVNATKNALAKPKGMVFDPYGNLYVVDSDNDRVVMYCANSAVGIVVVGG